MKKIIAVGGALLLLAITAVGLAQDSSYRGLTLAGTADVLIDSTLTDAVMLNKRVYIDGIYFWYDNAANTNQIFVEVVRGTSALRTAGSGRQFKYSEAMTSSGIKGITSTPNITTDEDSTIYFVIQATSSDSLFLHVNYKLIGN